MNLGQLSRFTAWLQVTLLVALLFILFILLPRHGLAALSDFNSPTKVASASPLLIVVNWIGLALAASMLLVVYVVYRHLRQSRPLVLAGLFGIVLFGTVLFFILHDVGFHIIRWADIEHDPASTNFAMDMMLWTIRNGMFCIAGLLTAFTLRRSDKHAPRSNS
ncbi:hypothetical protein TFLX_06712 [Thermoflexales bacterium]|nr:hypothetical protein TFLX_06712 [Thermoflexales bacterium]